MFLERKPANNDQAARRHVCPICVCTTNTLLSETHPSSLLLHKYHNEITELSIRYINELKLDCIFSGLLDFEGAELVVPNNVPDHLQEAHLTHYKSLKVFHRILYRNSSCLNVESLNKLH